LYLDLLLISWLLQVAAAAVMAFILAVAAVLVDIVLRQALLAAVHLLNQGLLWFREQLIQLPLALVVLAAPPQEQQVVRVQILFSRQSHRQEVAVALLILLRYPLLEVVVAAALLPV
jgi:hypothetical protein